MTGGHEPEAERRDMIAAVESKVAQADRDLLEKRVPYEADPLFMYLWRREFGTSAYQSTGIVRFLDRKIAHMIGYDAARQNYRVLTELPVRIREHLDALRG